MSSNVNKNEPDKEAEVFKTDMANRPRESGLEDYERVPIEAFGTALLKSMGWKEGQGIGKNGYLYLITLGRLLHSSTLLGLIYWG